MCKHRVGAATHRFDDVVFDRFEELREREHLAHLVLGDDADAVLIRHDQIAGTHRYAAQLHLDRVARAGATIADRLLDETAPVDRQIQLFELVDVARHAVDHAAHEAIVARRETRHAAKAVHVHATRLVDHEHVTGMAALHRL